MPSRKPTERKSQRVVLRQPLPIDLGTQRAMLLELGTGGVKIEHQHKLTIGERVTLPLPEATLKSVVRYCTMQPSATGVIYHSGLEFVGVTPQQNAAIYEMLLQEAENQVLEWEANLQGVRPSRPAPGASSSVVHRFLWLRFTREGWTRTPTSDPNQPIDGISVPDDTPQKEIALLCATYEAADAPTRDYLRSCAMFVILERLRSEVHA